MKTHTRAWKEKQLPKIKELIDSGKVLAIANIESVPASLFQELRGRLAGTAEIKVSKKRVIKKALAQSKFSSTGIEKYLKGSIAIISTDLDPFELYSLIKKNKIRTFLKAGDTANSDIIVPAGDTGLAPGPDLSVLKAARIPSEMKGASIQVPKDTTVLKKGEKASPEIAAALAKLDIKPAEIMLRIEAATDGQLVFEGSAMDIDLEKFESDLIECHKKAFNLAFNTAYFTSENIELFLQKAFREAKSLALEAGVLNSSTIPELLAKAQANAASLKTFEKPDEKSEEKPGAEEKPAEEKSEVKPEVKAEEKSEEKSEEKPAEEKSEEEPKPEEKAEEEPKAEAGEKPAEAKPEAVELPKIEEKPEAEEKPEEEKADAEEKPAEEKSEVKPEVKAEEKSEEKSEEKPAEEKSEEEPEGEKLKALELPKLEGKTVSEKEGGAEEKAGQKNDKKPEAEKGSLEETGSKEGLGNEEKKESS